MLGAQEMRLATYLNTKVRSAIVAAAVLCAFVSCSRAKKPEEHKMISIEWAVTALLDKEATVESVAKTLGQIESRRSVGFKVKATDAHLVDILIGTAGEDAKSAIPEYVQVDFDPNKPVHLNEFASMCDDWKPVPNTPGASPYLYGCRAKASTPKISVNILTTLSDDIHSPQARVVDITLQRGVW
jgi:hypothetical protein